MAYYDTRDMSTLMTRELLQRIDNIFAGYHVPIWIWWPIMMCESAGNYNLVNPGTASISERSIGLFQINIEAHGTRFGTEAQLKNPEHNTRVARDYFLYTAIQSDFVKKEFKYNKPKEKVMLQVYSGLVDPYSTAKNYISGGGGIKPYWTSTLRNKIVSYFNYIKNPNVDILGSNFVPGTGPALSDDSADIPHESIAGFTFARGGGPKSTSNLFTMDYTINEIQLSLDKLYANAPDVIKRRGNRIRETMKNLNIFISQHYIKEEQN